MQGKYSHVYASPECLAGFRLLQSYHKLFTVKDVLEHVEIWQRHHAIAILVATAEVFGDIAIENDMPVLSESTIDIEMDWEQVRDDSSYLNFFSSQRI